jgi:hypothetical protein
MSDVLSSFPKLSKALPGLTEQELRDLLDLELFGNRRKTFLVRLHQRYTMVRAERERKELLERAA